MRSCSTVADLAQGSLIEVVAHNGLANNPYYQLSTEAGMGWVEADSVSPLNPHIWDTLPVGVWEQPTPTRSSIGPKLIDANPKKGFHWPYFLYAPSRIKSDYILVEPNNSGRFDDFNIVRRRTKDLVLSRMEIARELGTPLLIPVFPRFDDETDGTIASQYLGRGMLEPYWQQRYPEISREDQQLIAMVEDARDRLEETGLNVDKKFLLSGFSASGLFANRFVALHPERVRAAAFGGHGWVLLPVANLEGVFLPYPYGVGDFEKLTGKPFDLGTFAKIPMYIYMASGDSNGWALPWYIGSWYDRGDIHQALIAKTGSSAIDMSEAAEKIYGEVGSSASFILYPVHDHNIADSMLYPDLIEFFSAHTNR